MTPSPKPSKIQTQTCLAFKTARLELCPKPIQKPSQCPPQNGASCPKIGVCFSQTRSQFVPKTEPVFPKKQSLFFPKNGVGFSQKRSFPKSVAGFPKIGDGFPQSRWLVSPKSVADFPKIGDGFPQNWRRISQESVTDFPYLPIYTYLAVIQLSINSLSRPTLHPSVICLCIDQFVYLFSPSICLPI